MASPPPPIPSRLHPCKLTCSLSFSHSDFLPLPQAHQVSSCLRTFAPVPSAWRTLLPGSRRTTSSFLPVLLHLLSEAFPNLFPSLSSCLALTITTCYLICLFLLFIDSSTPKAKERFFLLPYLQYFLRSPTHSMYVHSFPSFLPISHQK